MGKPRPKNGGAFIESRLVRLGLEIYRAGEDGLAMTRYDNGAALERRVRADLQKHGWFVVRSAGSRGEVDLLAIGPDITDRAMIQCKRDGRMSIEDRRGLEALGDAFSALPILAYLDDGIQYSRIEGDGYKDWAPE